MTPKPPPIVEGNPNRREYHDMLGRPMRVGDFFIHAHAHSSSISMHVYKIAEFIDLPAPAYLGSIDGRRVESWNNAFKMKAISMDFDRVTKRLTLPKVWVKLPAPTYRHYQDVPEDQHRRSMISAVERVIRLDLDV